MQGLLVQCARWFNQFDPTRHCLTSAGISCGKAVVTGWVVPGQENHQEILYLTYRKWWPHTGPGARKPPWGQLGNSLNDSTLWPWRGSLGELCCCQVQDPQDLVPELFSTLASWRYRPPFPLRAHRHSFACHWGIPTVPGHAGRP